MCLSTAVCSLLHSLSYIFLEINYSIFFHLLLSAHLFDSFAVHPSVFLSFAPVLISSSTLLIFVWGFRFTFLVARQMLINNIIHLSTSFD